MYLKNDNMENLDKRLKDCIDSELENCASGLYPTLCSLKSSSVGKEKIYDLVKTIISVNPMDIKSALAQVESSL